jgi:hypothetical protein
VAISDQGVMRQLLRAPDLPRAPDFIDLRRRNTGARLWEPIETLLSRPDRSIRVRAAPRYRTGDFIDVVAPAEPLRQELRAFLVNSLLVSLIISQSRIVKVAVSGTGGATAGGAGAGPGAGTAGRGAALRGGPPRMTSRKAWRQTAIGAARQ